MRARAAPAWRPRLAVVAEPPRVAAYSELNQAVVRLGSEVPGFPGRRDPAPDTNGTDPLYDQSQRVPQILPWLLMVVVMRLSCLPTTVVGAFRQMSARVLDSS